MWEQHITAVFRDTIRCSCVPKLRTNVSTIIHDVTSQKAVILTLNAATKLKCHILAETLWLQIIYSIIYDGKHGRALPVVAVTPCFYETDQLQANTTLLSHSVRTERFFTSLLLPRISRCPHTHIVHYFNLINVLHTFDWCFLLQISIKQSKHTTGLMS